MNKVVYNIIEKYSIIHLKGTVFFDYRDGEISLIDLCSSNK